MFCRMIRSAALAATGFWLMASAAHADQTVLKFWDNQQTESGLSKYQQEAVKRFEAENPDIKVEVTTIPYPEYQQRLLTAVQAGNGPDVSTVDQIWNSAFAEAGAIVPLDDLAKKSGVKAETFFPGAGSRPIIRAISGASRSMSTSGSSPSSTRSCSTTPASTRRRS